MTDDATTRRNSTITVSGVRSPVIEAGPAGVAEAVLFVHGNPGSSTDWTALVDAVGALARAVALDMPGFGKAESRATGPTTSAPTRSSWRARAGSSASSGSTSWCTTSAAPSASSGACSTRRHGRAWR